MPATAKLHSDIVNLRNKRKDLYNAMVKLGGQDRELTSEEDEKFDKMYKDIESLDQRIKRMEELYNEDDENDDDDDNERSSDGSSSDENNNDDNKRSKKRNINHRNNNNHNANLAQFGLSGNGNIHNRQRFNELKSAVYDYLKHGNLRNLQADIATSGGNLILPEEISSFVIRGAIDSTYAMKLATIMPVDSSESFGVPTLDDLASDAEWTTEIAKAPEDPDTPKFGKRTLRPHPLKKALRVSDLFLYMSSAMSYMDSNDGMDTSLPFSGQGVTGAQVNMPNNFQPGFGNSDDLVLGEMSRLLGYTVEKAVVSGDGVNKPLGLFVNSAQGIPTTRDVVTGSATGVTYDGLVNISTSLKDNYTREASWLLSREFMRRVLLLKDSQNRPILNFATLPNMPTTLFDRPIYRSEFIPSAFTNNAYVGIFGSFKYYIIAIRRLLQIKRSEHIYIENNQVGFFLDAYIDGMPMKSEAFTRIKCGT